MSYIDDYDVEYYVDEKINLKDIRRKTCYVSNFAVLPKYKYFVLELIKRFFDQARSKGYEYLIFNALDDTLNLLKDQNKINSLSNGKVVKILKIESNEFKPIILLKI